MRVPSSFTTYWSRDRVVAARKHAPPDFRFDLLFGGPHVSMPSFSRAGVVPGDWIYPIHVHGGALHVLGRMRVVRIIPIADFRPAAPMGLTLTFLRPTCTDEAVVGESGTPLMHNLVLPPEGVENLTYVSKRGRRDVKKHLRDARVISLAGFQGNYRLSEESGAELAGLVESAESGVLPNRRAFGGDEAWSETPDWE